ncbi:MAG: hypothetical protein RL605_131 [Actinomycetota bacterium]|jgi:hypothetical protein
MANKLTPKNDARGVRTYLIFSAIIGLGTGILWFAGVHKLDESLIATGIAFIVSLVVVATLALTVKDESHDPDQPRLK